MTYYLSGPMTGFEAYNRPEFNKVADQLRKYAGIKDLINPAEHDEGEKPWEYYLKRDIKMILDNNVGGLILLPGWQTSRGARIEVRVATEVLNATMQAYRGTDKGFTLTPVKIFNEIIVDCRHDKELAQHYRCGL